MEQLLSRLIPFVMAGLMIVLAVIGLIVLSNLLVVAFVVGCVLFFVGFIKQKCFGHSPNDVNSNKQADSGRIIEGEKEE